MRPFLFLALAPFLCASSAAFAYSTPVAAKAGPAIVPYLCSGGAIAELVYENGAGSRHAGARLSFDGHDWELHEAPSFSGLRYSAAEGDRETIWSVTGENAMISRVAAGAPEQEVARCVRLRGARPGGPSNQHGQAAH